MTEPLSIEEGNKMIALSPFGGARLHVFGRKERFVFDDNRGSTRLFVSVRQLKYHTSWSWLMPVVEKIEEEGATVNISFMRCIISCNDDNDYKIARFTTNKIQATWLAVVAFIQRFNQQNKKP